MYPGVWTLLSPGHSFWLSHFNQRSTKCEEKHVYHFYIKQVKPSLKAKYCPQLSCRQKTHKNPHDLDLWPWYSIGFYRLSRYMFTQNYFNPGGSVHELLCSQSFSHHFAMVRNPKICPWTRSPANSCTVSAAPSIQNFIKLIAAGHELSCYKRKKLSWKKFCHRYREQ